MKFVRIFPEVLYVVSVRGAPWLYNERGVRHAHLNLDYSTPGLLNVHNVFHDACFGLIESQPSNPGPIVKNPVGKTETHGFFQGLWEG